MYSIYHLFKCLAEQKTLLTMVPRLEDFPYDVTLLSCRNRGKFPDMAIRLNRDRSIFTGGELVELKGSRSYSIASFNSTIPTGSKAISKIIAGKASKIKQQMENAGDEISSLPVRQVFYLIRGRNQGKYKVCLTHGNFFETLPVETLIQKAFAQILDEELQDRNEELPVEFRPILLSIFSKQESFSKVRNIENASVNIRFRIMTEAKAEGNILNSEKYPEILEDTLNLVLPCDDDIQEAELRQKVSYVFSDAELQQFQVFKLKHHFNGYFLVFQTSL